MMVSFVSHWPRPDCIPISEPTIDKGTLSLMIGF